jgi:hypothetical protein
MKQKIIFITLFTVVFISVIFCDKFFLSGGDPGPGLFYQYAHFVFNGYVAYKDFMFEYPPAALFFMLAPRIFSASFFIYQMVYLSMIYLMSVVSLWFVMDLAKEKSNLIKLWVPILFILCFYLLGPISIFRYDLIPAFLVILALWLKFKKYDKFAYFALAIGAMTKIYPGLLLAFFVIDDFRDKKKLCINLGFFALGVILSLLPFMSHLGDLMKFIHYQAARGIQVESLWANILMIKHIVSGNNLQPIVEAGAISLVPFPKYMVWLSQLILVAGYGGLIWLYAKTRRIFVISVLAILLFILANRVFSPQYFAWLIFLFPLVLLEIKSYKIWLPAAILFAVGCYLTKLIYPFLYLEKDFLSFATYSVTLFTIRNISLVFAFILIVINELIHLKKDHT